MDVEIIRERLYKAINSIGSEESLEMMVGLGSRVPDWLRLHLQQDHTIPSPSRLLDCRYQLWCHAKGYDPDQDVPVSWKIRQVAGILQEPYWLHIFSLAGFDIELPMETYPCGLRITCSDCTKLGLAESNDGQRELLKQLSISPPISLHNFGSAVIENAIGLKGEVVWWRKISVDSIPAELSIGNDLGKLSENNLTKDNLKLTPELVTKWLMNEAFTPRNGLTGVSNGVSSGLGAHVGSPLRRAGGDNFGTNIGITKPRPSDLSPTHLGADFGAGFTAKSGATQGRRFPFVVWSATPSDLTQMRANLGSIEAGRHVRAMLLRERSSLQCASNRSTILGDSRIIKLSEPFVPRDGTFLCNHGHLNYIIMQAHPDAFLGADDAFEMKSTTGIGFKKLTDSYGVSTEYYNHYMQAQLYLFAADKERCLYMATTPDPGLLQSTLRQKKRYGLTFELEPIYLEWIERDEETIKEGLKRAELIANDAESDEPAPKEFSGQTHSRLGKRIMPCGYCPFAERCNALYGYGEGLSWGR